MFCIRRRYCRVVAPPAARVTTKSGSCQSGRRERPLANLDCRSSRRQPVREWFLSVYRDPERTTSHRLAGFTECRKNPRFADARRDWRRFRSERSYGLPRAKTTPTPRLVSGSGKSRSPRPGRFAIYSRRKSRCSPSFGQADRMTCRLPAISGVKSPSSPVPALLARLRAAPASRFNWPAKSRHR